MKNLSEEYLAYIKSDAWYLRRAVKLLVSGALTGKVLCEMCRGSFYPRSVHVHHKNYDRLGSEREDDLQVLCRRCHGVIEEVGAVMSGGCVSHISETLSEILKQIDDRLAPEAEIEIPKIKVRPELEGLSEEEQLEHLCELINSKRRSQGLPEQPYQATAERLAETQDTATP